MICSFQSTAVFAEEYQNADTAKTRDKAEKNVIKESKKSGIRYDGPKVIIDGIIDARYQYRDDKSQFDVPANAVFDSAIGKVGGNQYDYSKDWGVKTNGVMNIGIVNKTTRFGDLRYGADLEIGLRATKDSTYSSNALYKRGASVFMGNNWGTLSGGYQDGAEVLMRLDAAKIAAFGSESDSDWYRNVNVEGADGSLPFYLQSSLYSENLFSGAIYSFSYAQDKVYFNESVCNKLPFRVSYYSPSFMGLKFGISYSPYYRDSLFTSNSTVNVKGVSSRIAPPNPKHNILTIDSKVQAATGSNLGSGEITGQSVTGAIERANLISDATEFMLAGTGNPNSKYFVYSAALDLAGKTNDIPVTVSKIQSTVKSGTTTPAYSSGQVVTMLEDAIKEATGQIIDDNMVDFIGPKYENIISGGVVYEHDLGLAKFKIAATGEIGVAKDVKDLKFQQYAVYTKFNDLAGFNLCAEIDYKGFKVAGSYANLNKSGVLKAVYEWDATSSSYVVDGNSVLPRQKSTYYWTLGAGYGYKDGYVSATYFYSDKQDGNIFTDFSLGLDYNLSLNHKAKFAPYIAWHYFTTEAKILPSPSSIDNKGNVILAGVKFTF